MEILTGAGFDDDPLLRNAVTSPDIAMSDIVSALSFALDLTEGALPGHAVRSCLLGMRIAEPLGLTAEEKTDLYYALLLKDAGCSSNAARLMEIIGGRRSRWAHMLPELGIMATLRRALPAASAQHRSHAEIIRLRAERGARIVAKIGLSPQAAEVILHLDEHWNGSGFPGGLRGEDIPLGSRIASIAQCLDVFHLEFGLDAAMAMLKKRSGSWFDPKLVKAALSVHRGNALWSGMGEGADRDLVLALDPGLAGRTTMAEIDNICEAFADVVDARSSFTYEHSMGVTRAASMIAKQLGLAPERQKLIYRAALLHDIGKLRIPNSILDKPGKLDATEWKVIREHPLLTQRILGRIARFDLIARTASQHHERLDGSGYPHGLRAEHLSVEARVIAVADVYGALSEDRPYRPALSMDEITSIMSKEVPEKLDPACFHALLGALNRGGGTVRGADGKIHSSQTQSPRGAAPVTYAS